MNLELSVSNLIGVGPKMAEKLGRLGIQSIRDLLFYYPRRYDDFTNPVSINSLRIGDEKIIKAKIEKISEVRTKRRWMSLIKAELKDESGIIEAVWFNQGFLLNVLHVGDELLFLGKVNWDFKSKKKNLTVMSFEKEEKILSIYGETEGLTSKFLRKITEPILKELTLEDYLPDEIKNSEKLLCLYDAICNIHFPKNIELMRQARRRIAFDELFFLALKMQEAKKELNVSRAPKIQFEEKMMKYFVAGLPYKLTNAQRKTAWEIIQDLGNSRPMNRLLEGDVGSGKTIVAAMAVLTVVKAGYQSVWLAPTTILANQHFLNVTKILKKSGVKVGLWTANSKLADFERDDLIIGTHALVQNGIKFSHLSLIIVDEQHRFGVKQRGFLQSVSGKQSADLVPHFLSMTATPIPRTLALAFYGDLDLSIIDEMPLGRQKVITKVINSNARQKAYDFIATEVKNGRQVFVICPLIDSKVNEMNGDLLIQDDRKTVMAEYNKLKEKIFPSLNIGLLHGRLKPKEKDEIMEQFKNGKIDILVATSVIEVGIDIPNASVMMIEGADSFGLAQLHQFRGRVGRGKHQSYCLLFSESKIDSAKKRLNAMITCDNGFELAEIDLELRGPGEFTGLRQSGLPDLKMASLSDRIMIEKATYAAEQIVKIGIDKYPKLLVKYKEFAATSHLE